MKMCVAFAEGLLSVADGAALIKLGAEDAELIFDEPLARATARVLAAGAEAVLETAGSAGAALVISRERVSVPIAAADGPVIDTMGAGDATFATVVEELAVSNDSNIIDPHAVLNRAMNVAAATIRAGGGLLRLPA
ncbi:hypothetical protein HQQ80_01605 [Microbacteriaceae bacterium VKM Ac-2855]|nr:hypothetical protein [Microbacteriaceae bacterium VKM Ac-2855]